MKTIDIQEEKDESRKKSKLSTNKMEKQKYYLFGELIISIERELRIILLGGRT